jgi:saccharopine dehydrogenase-like NADP-dependent oxidoreductase
MLETGGGAMKVVVLGCGLVGQEIARDLAREPGLAVTVVDRNEAALARLREGTKVETVVSDLSRPGTAAELARAHDLVVGAVPGWLGLRVVREVIDAGHPVADISFMPEDPYPQLDELARARGVPVVVDCGVAPGTSNLLVGHAASELDTVEDVRILVGGLPVVRRLPYEYAAVFSPADVLEEYTRPARVVENGREVIKPALDELEYLDFPGLGTLEAFLTDGLRTLRHTIDAPNMREKTLRYPGHCEKIRLLVETGLLDDTPIEIDGTKVAPRAVTARLLTQLWQLPEGEEDLTVMFIEVKGLHNGKEKTYSYQLVDVFDPENGVTSMARTTGYACTGIVRLMAAGKIDLKGVIPLELLGKSPELYGLFRDHLTQRGIVISETIE